MSAVAVTELAAAAEPTMVVEPEVAIGRPTEVELVGGGDDGVMSLPTAAEVTAAPLTSKASKQMDRQSVRGP